MEQLEGPQRNLRTSYLQSAAPKGHITPKIPENQFPSGILPWSPGFQLETGLG